MIRSRARELTAVGLLIMAILLVFFREALIPNQILSAADGVFLTPFFSESAPSTFDKPANPLLFDQVYQFTPWRYFSWKSIRAGVLPLWNPYSSTGTPFVATMQSAVFYPVNLLLVALPFELTFVWSAILRLWIAGIFTYALARRYGLAHVPALIAAVSFMLAGFQIVWLGHPHTNVSIWLPALILLAEGLIQTSEKRKAIQYIIALSLVIGVQFTGGHVETSVDILFAFGLYYLLRWFQTVGVTSGRGSQKFKRLFLPVIPLLLGSALASVQLLPFIEWLFLSAEFYKRASGSFVLIDPSLWKHTLSLLTVVFPNIYNNPTWNYPYWSFLLNWSNYNELVFYVGVLTLLLATIGLFHRHTSRWHLVKVFVIIVVLSLGRALHWPIFDWINQLPGFDLSNPGRLRLVVSFGLCILSAYGAQLLLDAQSTTQISLKHLWLKLCGVVVGMGVAILAGCNFVLPLLRHRIVDYGRRMVEVEYAQRSTHSNPLEYYYAQVDQMVEGLVAAFKPSNWAMYLPAIWSLLGLLLVIWSIRSRSVNRTVLGASLFALVTLDLLTFGQGYNPVVSIRQFYPSNSLISYIAKDDTLFRITALRQDLVPDAHMMFGFSDIRGLDFPTRWYSQYLSLIPDQIPWLSYGSIFSSTSSPLMRVLNLKYVITSNADTLAVEKGVHIVARAGNAYLGELAEPQPRAFVVYEAIAVPDDEKALNLLRNEPEAVFHRVVLSDAEAYTVPLVRPRNSDVPLNNVQVLFYNANHASWRVTTKQDGYLFVSDAYYPGWVAYLDDVPTTLYRANIAFRAVFVPAGEHTVSFRYEPVVFKIGVGISTAALFICAVVLVGMAVEQRHAGDGASASLQRHG